MTASSDRILAAGGVLWRGNPLAPEVALVHRPRYDDWSLPKGKLEPGEHPLVCALREVREETGQHSVPGRRLGRLRYPQNAASGPPTTKEVQYWALQATGGDFIPSDEVDRLAWLPPQEAAARLTYERDRAPLARLTAQSLELSTVLLVRHARAGARSRWSGPDELRPLDPVGQRQSLLLRDVLSCYLPSRVVSADLVRCRQTVSPLAEMLGLEVSDEPALSDRAWALRPKAALRRLRQLGAEGQCTVVCAQGGAIPALVENLADQDGARLGSPRSRKGSVWALFFDGPTVRDGFYLANLEPPLPL